MRGHPGTGAAHLGRPNSDGGSEWPGSGANSGFGLRKTWPLGPRGLTDLGHPGCEAAASAWPPGSGEASSQGLGGVGRPGALVTLSAGWGTAIPMTLHSAVTQPPLSRLSPSQPLLLAVITTTAITVPTMTAVSSAAVRLPWSLSLLPLVLMNRARTPQSVSGFTP